MERAELVARLDGHEWSDIEFKEARRAVPRAAYETVSAFANTGGGYIVFGVRQGGGGFQVVGVEKVDKVQGDFLTALRQPDKISTILDVKEELRRHENSDLLIFHVPEARRADKPVHLNGDIRRSFVRRGGGDVRCSEAERNRFLIDAMADRFDGQAVERALDGAFDDDSLRWYRATYEARPDNRSYAGLTDLEFLDRMGLLVESDGGRRPTRAAVLLFGTESAFRQLLPRPVVDCQIFAAPRAEADTGARWVDRAVLDENLVRGWRALVDWYGRFAERPFRIDPTSLQRDDTPPDYRAYREAMINLLVHQDYSDHARNAEIRHYTDRTVFWNPGDAFAQVDLLEPGEKEVRNPRIVTAFRRIGLSENAGWGLRDVSLNWRELGNTPPRIVNDRSRKRFTLELVKEKLLSDRQLAFQARLGVRLTDDQARAFALVFRNGEATLREIGEATGLPTQEAAAVAERLETRRLVEPVGGAGRYALADHLREDAGLPDWDDRKHGDSASRQVDRPTPDLLTDQVDGPSMDLHTGQVGGPTTDLPTRHVDRPPPDLHTGQVDPPATDLYTDQVDRPAPDLATRQVGRPTPDLATHQVDRPPPDLHTDQVGRLTELSATQWRIVEHCDAPRRLTEIMAMLGVTGRNYLRTRHLDPLIRAGVVAMTNPDKPRASNQRYVVTEAGARLLARRAGGGSRR